MKLGSLFFTGALACDRCIGCADGVQIVNPIGVELLCQDEKAYVQVDDKTNFAKIDARRLKDYYDASRCSVGSYRWEANYSDAGSTTFSGYRVQFDNDGNAFLKTDDMLLAESESIKLDDGSIVQNNIKAGNAGDCYSSANCDLTKLGQFSIDLTDTGLAFAGSVQWKYSEQPTGEPTWPAHMQMADYVRTDQLVAARCGGRCGFCAPDVQDDLIPLVKFEGTPSNTTPAEIKTRINNLLEVFAEVLEAGVLRAGFDLKYNRGRNLYNNRYRRMTRMKNKMIWRYEDLRDEKHCTFLDAQDDQVQVDREDPCEGLKQVFTGFRNWGKIFNRNCRNADRWFSFHNRREKVAIKFRDHTLQRLKCEGHQVSRPNSQKLPVWEGYGKR